MATRPKKNLILDLDETLISAISEDEYNPKKHDKKMGQIGCYLSHFNIYKKIKKENKDGYTIIFEDDFLIKSENLLDEVKKAINILNTKNIDYKLKSMPFMRTRLTELNIRRH